VTSVAPAAPPAGSPEAVPSNPPLWRSLGNRVIALCLVELQKLRHDRSELYTRAIQPALWLLIFGETFTRLRAIPTGDIPYVDYLAPGILAQSALFMAIFYGIQIIWERDVGILTKLLVTPTPRAALIAGKSFAAGLRALSQVVVVLALSAALGVGLSWNPLHLLGTIAATLLGAAFFATVSMTIAGLARTRERLMGIGQAITMPLFFASNALYPVDVMPTWLRWLSMGNPLSYEVEALRGMLLGSPARLVLCFAVLVVALLAGITTAALLLPRLAR
jgi:ABC-2 type transport system permease protein